MKKTVGWSEDLGSKLKALRLSHKVKQIDLARSLGISPAYLNLIENNKRPMHVDILEKLLDFFAIDMNVFMSATEGVKLQNRMDSILKDSLLRGHSLGTEELEILAKNSSISNLIFTLFDGYQNTKLEAERVSRRMFSDEQRRETEEPGPAAESVHILDRIAYDEVTDFLEHHHNFFPDIETEAERLLAEEKADDGRRTSVLTSILKKRFDIEVVERDFPPESGLLRLYNDKTRRLYVSNTFGVHRLHFQLANFIGLLTFDREPIVDELIAGFDFGREEAKTLAKVNLANYFAGAMLLPYDGFIKRVQETMYDVRAIGGMVDMPFEPIAHRICTLSKPGASAVPMHFIRTDIAGNISKRYSGSGIKIDDRRRSCPKWAVHTAFLTPSMLRRQFSIMPDGEQYFCFALAHVRHDEPSLPPANAISVGIGCRADEAHHFAYSRGLKFENPDRDCVKVGITCRLCDRPDCSQRALPSFKMQYEINTINRKANVLTPIRSEDLLLVAEENVPDADGKANGSGSK